MRPPMIELTFVGILMLALTSPTEPQSLDSLIEEVFHGKNEDESTNGSTSKEDNRDAGENPLSCECVPYYQCSENGTIIQDGVGLIDIRLGSSTNELCSCPASNAGIKEGPCENYLDVCCQKPLTENITPKPQIKRGCGNRHPDGVGFRITGDEDNEAQFGEFPWMVAVLRQQPEKKNLYQCGGALIHKQVVLTAAHCVAGKKPPELKIRAGEWDTQTTNELFPHQDRGVAKVIIHNKYYAGALYYDVALLILVEPVEIADNVDIVCLPKQGEVLDHSRCYASGWGKDVFGKEGRYQVILKKIDLPVVPHETCQTGLRKTRLGNHFVLHESFICAGGELGKDTCKGDGGSPLVCPFANDATRYQQAGIVAWGIGCGDQTPGVYANVALLRTWIDEQMTANNLDTSSYEY